MRESETHPTTQEEFDALLKNVDGEYKKSLIDIYKYGKKLSVVCKENNVNRKNLQNRLLNNRTKYMSLRYGFLANSMAKGYTEKAVREKMGYKNNRHLNGLMWEKMRGDVKPSVRWRILKRDNFRCVLCGSDATDRKLHIDHIIPISEGGNSRIKNLRVLCDACNIGRNTDLKQNIVDFASPSKNNQHTTKLNTDAE